MQNFGTSRDVLIRLPVRGDVKQAIVVARVFDAVCRAEGGTVSAWLADAAERKLRAQGLREVVDDWQDEHGAFSESERRRARRELGLIDQP